MDFMGGAVNRRVNRLPPCQNDLVHPLDVLLHSYVVVV